MLVPHRHTATATQPLLAIADEALVCRKFFGKIANDAMQVLTSFQNSCDVVESAQIAAGRKGDGVRSGHTEQRWHLDAPMLQLADLFPGLFSFHRFPLVTGLGGCIQ